MTRVYNPDFFQHLKSNLKGFISENTEKPQLTEEEKLELENEYASYSNHLFQILVFDGDIDNLEQDESNFKLVYGKKKNLERWFEIDNSSLPTCGVKVNADFMPLSNGNTNLSEILQAEYATVRFLLQSRKLSQLTASTWLDDEGGKQLNASQIKRKLVKKIFHTYNIRPDIYWVDDEYRLSKKPMTAKELQKKLEEENINKHFLVKLNSISYNSISLVLLLSGQAYYKADGTYENICGSIFSTYEMIWEYGIDLSWDTFYARREDISQSGLYPNPPFTKVILAYPPRPHDDSLSQKQIENWVTAKDEWEYEETPTGESEEAKKVKSLYPFYPEEGTDEWEDKQLEYIVPPYPYIPLSCM